MENKIKGIDAQKLAKQKLLEESRAKKEEKRGNKRQIFKAVSYKQFIHILSCIDPKAKSRERLRVGIILLYLIGQPVLDLLTYKVSHIKQLMEKGEPHMPFIIKEHERTFKLLADGKAKTKLLEYEQDIRVLIQDKPDNPFLFTAGNQSTRPILSSRFLKEIYGLLSLASVKF